MLNSHPMLRLLVCSEIGPDWKNICHPACSFRLNHDSEFYHKEEYLYHDSEYTFRLNHDHGSFWSLPVLINPSLFPFPFRLIRRIFKNESHWWSFYPCVMCFVPEKKTTFAGRFEPQRLADMDSILFREAKVTRPFLDSFILKIWALIGLWDLAARSVQQVLSRRLAKKTWGDWPATFPLRFFRGDSPKKCHNNSKSNEDMEWNIRTKMEVWLVDIPFSFCGFDNF